MKFSFRSRNCCRLLQICSHFAATTTLAIKPPTASGPWEKQCNDALNLPRRDDGKISLSLWQLTPESHISHTGSTWPPASQGGSP